MSTEIHFIGRDSVSATDFVISPQLCGYIEDASMVRSIWTVYIAMN